MTMRFDETETVTVKVPAVFTYTDADFKDEDGNGKEYVIDLASLKQVGGDVRAVVTRALLYGWGRALNDAKGSSDTKTEAERMESQGKRYNAIMADTWTVGGGGGAKLDPVFVELRAILQLVRKEAAGAVAKAFKNETDVRKAYGDTATDMWLAAAKKSVLARAALASVEVDVDVQTSK